MISEPPSRIPARPPLHLRALDIRRLAALTVVAGEGSAISASERRKMVREAASYPTPGYTPADSDDLHVPSAETLLEMRRLQNDHMTEQERNLSSFTRKNLKKLDNWIEWRDADDKQLDAHFKAGALGKPVPRPTTLEGRRQVFRGVWARLVKATGVRKSRLCLDGSKRAAPWLRQLVKTYASCIEIPCLRLFFAICAERGWYVSFGDVDNAYQQSPPPSVDCYLEIDEALEDYLLRKHGIKVDRLSEVIPLLKALQGHPEAGALWE